MTPLRPMLALALAWLVLAAAAGPALGHAGHETIPEEQAVVQGRELIGLLVKRGKLDASWGAASLEGAALELPEGIDRWHLVFRNDREADPARRRLHVFLNYDGQFLGANFTGESR